MCERPSQLPRTQPVHMKANRHKLGSQGVREVQEQQQQQLWGDGRVQYSRTLASLPLPDFTLEHCARVHVDITHTHARARAGAHIRARPRVSRLGSIKCRLITRTHRHTPRKLN